MQLTDVRVHLCESTGRLKAFCCLTFDDCFVVRDVKLIEGDEGLFLAMPAPSCATTARAVTRRTTCAPATATIAGCGWTRTGTPTRASASSCTPTSPTRSTRTCAGSSKAT
ncbi:MAG: SpoVG family protein [Tepidisphaeraceae bacterium]